MNNRSDHRVIATHSSSKGRLRITNFVALAVICLAVCLLFFAGLNDGRVDASTPQVSVPDKPADLDSLLQALESNDTNVSSAAHIALQKQHAHLVDRLLAIAKIPQKGAQSESPKARAIELLGAFGVQDAAPFLVKNIEYHKAELRSGWGPLAGYHCAKALRTLGPTAMPAIFEYLRTRHTERISDEAIELYADVLRMAYDREGGIPEAVTVVQRARDRTPKDRRADLDRLFECLSLGGKKRAN